MWGMWLCWTFEGFFTLSNDILTSIWWQLCWQPCFSHFLLVKNNGERKRKREDNNIMWVWERNCQKVVKKWLSKYHFSFTLHALFFTLAFERKAVNHHFWFCFFTKRLSSTHGWLIIINLWMRIHMQLLNNIQLLIFC
jgi:hypothetical protein